MVPAYFPCCLACLPLSSSRSFAYTTMTAAHILYSVQLAAPLVPSSMENEGSAPEVPSSTENKGAPLRFLARILTVSKTSGLPNLHPLHRSRDICGLTRDIFLAYGATTRVCGSFPSHGQTDA
eukprot:g78642.t1